MHLSIFHLDLSILQLDLHRRLTFLYHLTHHLRHHLTFLYSLLIIKLVRIASLMHEESKSAEIVLVSIGHRRPTKVSYTLIPDPMHLVRLIMDFQTDALISLSLLSLLRPFPFRQY